MHVQCLVYNEYRRSHLGTDTPRGHGDHAELAPTTSQFYLWRKRQRAPNRRWRK